MGDENYAIVYKKDHMDYLNHDVIYEPHDHYCWQQQWMHMEIHN